MITPITWQKHFVILSWKVSILYWRDTKAKILEYKEYEPLFDCATAICEKQKKKAFYVVCDTYVTLTDGTGVVHIAPAFGEDDSKVGRSMTFRLCS